MRRLRRYWYSAAICSTLALGFGSSPVIAQPCASLVGARVLLAADTVDPDVFLWDSRARLISYIGGNWGSTRDVLAHTTLIGPGTLGVVMSCHVGEGHPKDALLGVEDVVGVRILTGAHRRLWGWAASDDVHPLRRPTKEPRRGAPPKA